VNFISLKRCSNLNLLCSKADLLSPQPFTAALSTSWNIIEMLADLAGSFTDIQKVCQEENMVVGRTLWDFLWELIQNPKLRASFLVMLILLELAFIILALLIHSGLLTMKFSFGGFEVEVPPFVLS
jgi:hypothetical protein